jgi:diguanylate cyclase (GGDEF)-like protein
VDTLLEISFVKLQVPVFNLLYTLSFCTLCYLAMRKKIEIFYIQTGYLFTLSASLLTAYAIKDTFIESFNIIIIFPVIVIFLTKRLVMILLWITAYYGVFIWINVSGIGKFTIDTHSLIQILFLHGAFALAVWFYVHVNTLKTRLLNIQKLRIEKSKKRLQAVNDAMILMNERLERYATIDELTGMPNRRSLFDFLANRMERFARKKEFFSIVLIDIDHFKSVNDTYGHQKGDEVLQKVAKVQQKQIRTIDFVARYGGEEFMMVLEEEEQDRIAVVMERLLLGVEERVVCEGGAITISAGVATICEAESLESVIHRADQALYEAKEAGRNRFVFSSRDKKS